MCMLSCFSCVQLFASLCTVACQAPLCMGFSRQEFWSGSLCPPQGLFQIQGSNLHLLHYRQVLYCWAIREAHYNEYVCAINFKRSAPKEDQDGSKTGRGKSSDLRHKTHSQRVGFTMASSTLAWKIPWTEEPGRLQSMGSLRVGHDRATSLSLFTFMHWRRKWQPTPVFLPGESQGRRSLVGCQLWGRTESDTTEAT